MSSKSQISIEFITIFGILLAMLFGVLIVSFAEKKDAEKTKEFFEEKQECLKISSIISSLYSSGEGTSAKTSTKYNLEIKNKTIFIKDAYCRFFADTQQKNITGKLFIKNKGNTITIENY